MSFPLLTFGICLQACLLYGCWLTANVLAGGASVICDSPLTSSIPSQSAPSDVNALFTGVTNSLASFNTVANHLNTLVSSIILQSSNGFTEILESLVSLPTSAKTFIIILCATAALFASSQAMDLVVGESQNGQHRTVMVDIGVQCPSARDMIGSQGGLGFARGKERYTSRAAKQMPAYQAIPISLPPLTRQASPDSGYTSVLTTPAAQPLDLYDDMISENSVSPPKGPQVCIADMLNVLNDWEEVRREEEVYDVRF